MTTPVRTRCLAVAAALALAAPAHAIQPQTWVHDAEADFAKGETDGTVVTNLGDVKLAAEHRPVAELPAGLTAVYDVAVAGDAVYLAAGPEPTIVRVRDGKAETVLTLEGEQAFALHARGTSLLIGLSAEGGSRVAELNGDRLKTLVAVPGARYIWDIASAGLEVWLATGTEGQVYRAVLADTGAVAAEAVFDAGQANVLTLARGPAGVLYAGTDTEGLVYRLSPVKGGVTYEAFVAYDAAEAEIAALFVGDDGTVYAGTADAEGAKPGRLDKPEDKPAGRPTPATQETDADAEDEADDPDAEPEADAPADDDAEPAEVEDADDPGDAPAEPARTAGPAAGDDPRTARRGPPHRHADDRGRRARRGPPHPRRVRPSDQPPAGHEVGQQEGQRRLRDRPPRLRPRGVPRLGHGARGRPGARRRGRPARRHRR